MNAKVKPKIKLAKQIKWWDNFNKNLYVKICILKKR